ncbi:MAG TPA: hypothetical protein PKX06_08870, partial [Phenylobacterium sp.]|nr:hypothetical protein [Phenylobacterium sp.]
MVEAWAVLQVEAEELYDKHDRAQTVRRDLLARYGKPRRDFNGMACAAHEPDPAPRDYVAAVRDEDATGAKWERAIDRVATAAACILKVPAESYAMAEAKQRVFEATEFGGGSEDLMNQALRRDLRALANKPPSPPTGDGACPVAALAPAFEREVAEECVAEGAHDDDAANAAWRRREEMQARIVGLRASSIEGARLQLVFALDRACDARMSEEANRDQYVAECRALIVSALAALPGQTSDVLWSYYIGGEQPGGGDGAAGNDGPDNATRTTWEAARARYEATVKEASDYDAACDAGAVAISGDTEAEPWDKVADALFELELTPAPDIHALSHVMRESLNVGGVFDFPFQHADCANSLSDLLSADSDTALIASTYLQVLRLAGNTSDALNATPFARFDGFDADGWVGKDQKAAWEAHHADRRRALALAREPEEIVTGRDN